MFNTIFTKYFFLSILTALQKRFLMLTDKYSKTMELNFGSAEPVAVVEPSFYTSYFTPFTQAMALDGHHVISNLGIALKLIFMSHSVN